MYSIPSYGLFVCVCNAAEWGGGEGERGVRVVYHMVLVYSFFPQRESREGLKRGTLCNVITVNKFVVLLVLFVVFFDSWFGFLLNPWYIICPGKKDL
jgi:hypothetical protein